jgi:hypothetical protein
MCMLAIYIFCIGFVNFDCTFNKKNQFSDHKCWLHNLLFFLTCWAQNPHFLLVATKLEGLYRISSRNLFLRCEMGERTIFTIKRSALLGRFPKFFFVFWIAALVSAD